MPTQDVLAVRRDALIRSGLTLGFTPREKTLDIIREIYASGDFRPRPEVEKDSNFLQPIPCAVVHWKNRILTLERQEKHKRHALHGRLVLWAGGHVDVGDAQRPSSDLLTGCLDRELDEEVQLTTGSPDLQGIVFDGRSLHFAVVYDVPGEPPPSGVLEVSDEFRAGSNRSIRGSFVSLGDLERMYDRLETWSRMILTDVLLRKDVFRSHVPPGQLEFEQGSLRAEASG